MRTLFITFLALAAFVAAEEAKSGTKKRGIGAEIGYGYGPTTLGGSIDLTQVGNYLGGVQSSIPIASYGYGKAGYGYGGYTSGISGQYGQLNAGISIGSGYGPGALIPNSYSQGIPLGSSYGYGGVSSEVIVPGIPNGNGYNTGVGLGGYSGPSLFGATVDKHTTITNKIGIPVPQPYPVPVVQPLPVPVPQPIPFRVDAPYPVRYTQPIPVPVVRDYPVPVERPVPVPYNVPVPVPSPAPVPVPAPPRIQVAQPVVQPLPGIAFGSGSLGITQLNNGNYALGSGSIGYVGSLNAVAATPAEPHAQAQAIQSAPISQGGYYGGYTYGPPQINKGY